VSDELTDDAPDESTPEVSDELTDDAPDESTPDVIAELTPEFTPAASDESVPVVRMLSREPSLAAR
jgi:hypothetical protein